MILLYVNPSLSTLNYSQSKNIALVAQKSLQEIAIAVPRTLSFCSVLLTRGHRPHCVVSGKRGSSAQTLSLKFSEIRMDCPFLLGRVHYLA